MMLTITDHLVVEGKETKSIISISKHSDFFLPYIKEFLCWFIYFVHLLRSEYMWQQVTVTSGSSRDSLVFRVIGDVSFFTKGTSISRIFAIFFSITPYIFSRSALRSPYIRFKNSLFYGSTQNSEPYFPNVMAVQLSSSRGNLTDWCP